MFSCKKETSNNFSNFYILSTDDTFINNAYDYLKQRVVLKKFQEFNWNKASVENTDGIANVLKIPSMIDSNKMFFYSYIKDCLYYNWVKINLSYSTSEGVHGNLIRYDEKNKFISSNIVKFILVLSLFIS